MNGRFFGTNGAHADETRHIAVRNAETGEKKVAHRRAIRNFIKGGARVKGRSLFALLDRIIALTRRKSNPLSINRHFFATNKCALTRSDKIIRPTPAQLPFPAAIAPFRAAAALKRKGTGNLLALLDSSGNIVVQYKYDAWGNHTVTDANGNAITDADHIGNLNPFRYRGYYFDRETGFYFLQTRYYDPEVGRFLNMDSIEYADPESVNGINLYAYCGNNPVMGYDPDGTWDWLRAIAIAALAVVAVAAIAAITVATGGAATPVIAGAVIGAGISGASSAVSQLATTGEVQWEQVLVDASIGAVSGAFGGSAIGVGGMTVASFATGAAGSLASDWVAEEELDFKAALTAGAMNAVFTAKIGMGGVQYGKTAGHIAAKNTLKTAQRQWVKSVAGAYKQKQAYKSAQTALKSAKNILKQSSMFELTSRYAIGGHIVSFGSGFLLGLL